jgi:hypothetical protein
MNVAGRRHIRQQSVEGQRSLHNRHNARKI